jgi:hypothetical protein
MPTNGQLIIPRRESLGRGPGGSGRKLWSRTVRTCIQMLIATTFLFVVYGGNVVQSKDRNTGLQHESLHAYPEAVLSATDAVSGITVSVDPDGKFVSAKDRAGTVLWRENVLEKTGRPSEGAPVVRHVAIMQDGKVSLVVGKHRYVEADLMTGKLRLAGED